MGYLDNSSITVDAILTKKGRELLSLGNFNIDSFALSDDEIDYSLYNINHPDGSQYAGQAIENMPVLEAFPDELNMMRHKLITLTRGSTKIPVITSVTDLILDRGIATLINPYTSYMDGQNTASTKESGYIITIADRRLFTKLEGSQGNVINTDLYSDATAVSATAHGPSFTLTPIISLTLFGTNSYIITTATIEGLDTGAKTTISITINKD